MTKGSKLRNDYWISTQRENYRKNSLLFEQCSTWLGFYCKLSQNWLQHCILTPLLLSGTHDYGCKYRLLSLLILWLLKYLFNKMSDNSVNSLPQFPSPLAEVFKCQSKTQPYLIYLKWCNYITLEINKSSHLRIWKQCIFVFFTW